MPEVFRAAGLIARRKRWSVYWPHSFRREGLVEGRGLMRTNHNVASSSLEEWCVTRKR